MTRYAYDLHIHSCLSPCADDDMTPANIAGMAVLNGLQLLALTDHNSCGNCPAFMEACRQYGIVPVPGMELTTAEEIHMVCLFRTLEDAMEFDRFVESRRIEFPNDPDIFGHQYIMDEADNILGEEPDLLINAADISLEEAFEEVIKRGGVAYPAHIDRQSNGIIAVLGTFPPEPHFTAYELNDGNSDGEYRERFPMIKPLSRAVSSDAHYLWDISEAKFSLKLDDEPYSSQKVRDSLIDYLLGKDKGNHNG